MTTKEKQLEQLDHYFSHHTSFFIDDARKKLDLAQALQDTDAAMKEQSKLEAMIAVQEVFDIAKEEKTLEDVKRKYHEGLEIYRKGLQLEIDNARAAGDKQKSVLAQIQLTVAKNPATGLFYAAYQKATGNFAKVAHE